MENCAAGNRRWGIKKKSNQYAYHITSSINCPTEKRRIEVKKFKSVLLSFSFPTPHSFHHSVRLLFLVLLLSCGLVSLTGSFLLDLGSGGGVGNLSLGFGTGSGLFGLGFFSGGGLFLLSLGLRGGGLLEEEG